MWIAVVRHAHAGDRHAFHGPDDQRPLTARGRQAAEGLVALFAEAGVTRLISSPAVRCIETLLPLGAALELDVEPEPRLYEGAARSEVLEVLDELGGVPSVICTHGDIVPDLLGHLKAQGVTLTDPPTWPKASTWILEGPGLTAERARYVPPPV